MIARRSLILTGAAGLFAATCRAAPADPVTLTGHNAARTKAGDAVIRYDFLLEGERWKIDDIRGIEEGKPWSIRGMLDESLKN
jgi:hypothetical protein